MSQTHICVNPSDDIVLVTSNNRIILFKLSLPAVLSHIHPDSDISNEDLIQPHYSTRHLPVEHATLFHTVPFIAFSGNGSSNSDSQRTVRIFDYSCTQHVQKYRFTSAVKQLASVGTLMVTSFDHKIHIQSIPTLDPATQSISRSLLTSKNQETVFAIHDAVSYPTLCAMMERATISPYHVDPKGAPPQTSTCSAGSHQCAFYSNLPLAPVTNSFLVYDIDPPQGSNIPQPPSAIGTAMNTMWASAKNMFGQGSTPQDHHHNTSNTLNDDPNNPDVQLASYVCIFDLHTLQITRHIEVCKGHIRLLKISPDGRLLAVASHKGTLIRVFDTLSGKLLHTFRRGMQPATITTMSFSFNNELLVVASLESQYVHIFKLTDWEFDDSLITEESLRGISAWKTLSYQQQHPHDNNNNKSNTSTTTHITYHDDLDDVSPRNSTITTTSTGAASSNQAGMINWGAISAATSSAASAVSSSFYNLSAMGQTILGYQRRYAHVFVNIDVNHTSICDLRIYPIYSGPLYPLDRDDNTNVPDIYSQQQQHRRHHTQSTHASSTQTQNVVGWILLIFTTNGMCYMYRGGKEQGKMILQSSLSINKDDGRHARLFARPSTEAEYDSTLSSEQSPSAPPAPHVPSHNTPIMAPNVPQHHQTKPSGLGLPPPPVLSSQQPKAHSNTVNSQQYSSLSGLTGFQPVSLDWPSRSPDLGSNRDVPSVLVPPPIATASAPQPLPLHAQLPQQPIKNHLVESPQFFDFSDSAPEITISTPLLNPPVVSPEIGHLDMLMEESHSQTSQNGDLAARSTNSLFSGLGAQSSQHVSVPSETASMQYSAPSPHAPVSAPVEPSTPPPHDKHYESIQRSHSAQHDLHPIQLLSDSLPIPFFEEEDEYQETNPHLSDHMAFLPTRRGIMLDATFDDDHDPLELPAIQSPTPPPPPPLPLSSSTTSTSTVPKQSSSPSSTILGTLLTIVPAPLSDQPSANLPTSAQPSSSTTALPCPELNRNRSLSQDDSGVFLGRTSGGMKQPSRPSTPLSSLDDSSEQASSSAPLSQHPDLSMTEEVESPLEATLSSSAHAGRDDDYDDDNNSRQDSSSPTDTLSQHSTKTSATASSATTNTSNTTATSDATTSSKNNKNNNNNKKGKKGKKRH